ncbi:MAG: M56 family metallopeptidase [Litorimonas sp.]
MIDWIQTGTSSEYLDPLNADIIVYTNAWQVWLVPIWGLGASYALLRPLRHSIGIYRLSRQSSKPLPENVERLFEELKLKVNFGRQIELRVNPKVTCLCIIGHLKPLIFIPIGLATHLSENEIEAVLAHELAHIFRNDYLHQLILSIIQSIFFYHPGLQFIAQVANKEREHACDDLALTLIENRKDLATGLLRLGLMPKPNSLALTAVSEDTKKLNRRISRLMNFEQGPQGMARPTVWGGIIVTMFLAPIFLLAGFSGEHSVMLKNQALIQHTQIVELKNEVCDQLKADRIYENPLYYTGGLAKITIDDRVLFMNQAPLPVKTQEAITNILEKQNFKDMNIVSLDFFADDVKLTVRKGQNHDMVHNAIYRVKHGKSDVFYSREKEMLG